MKYEKVQQLEYGLYKIYWKSGGHSLASVGGQSNGERWLAPTNWLYPSHGDRCWKQVKKVKLLYPNV